MKGFPKFLKLLILIYELLLLATFKRLFFIIVGCRFLVYFLITSTPQNCLLAGHARVGTGTLSSPAGASMIQGNALRGSAGKQNASSSKGASFQPVPLGQDARPFLQLWPRGTGLVRMPVTDPCVVTDPHVASA